MNHPTYQVKVTQVVVIMPSPSKAFFLQRRTGWQMNPLLQPCASLPPAPTRRRSFIIHRSVGPPGGIPDVPSRPKGRPPSDRITNYRKREKEHQQWRGSVDGGSKGGKRNLSTEKIDAVVTVHLENHSWQGTVIDKTLMLMCPLIGEDIDLRESLVTVLELAEQCLECHRVIICLERQARALNIVHDLLFVGFEPLHGVQAVSYLSPASFDVKKYLLLSIDL
ncbi:uncharacterized protein VTP21DRAFT_11648 [Calcarisporiella thermophila]|uniref:uncharacterized protein n=1 Tax=Calcarisporiella thermophila TaxID=911321 RepID=UPI0037430423